jgi:hypothetical protein
MWTKEQRAEAFKSYRIEVIDGKTYAVVTCDFGRRRGEVHVQDMYQRLASDKDAPRKLWYGTTIAADNRFNERQKRIDEARAFRDRSGQP